MSGQDLISSRGLSISIHLYGIGTTPSNFADELKKHKPTQEKSGFINVKTSEDIIQAEYIMLFQISTMGIQNNGEVGPVNFVSAEKGFMKFHKKLNLLELRGTRKSANKVSDILSGVMSINVFKIKISHEAMLELIKKAESISSVSITKIEDVSLSAVTIRGEDIINTDDFKRYINEMNGKITRIRGFFAFPSGVALPVAISANGTIQVFKRGEGFYPDDLNWLVNQIFEIATKFTD